MPHRIQHEAVRRLLAGLKSFRARYYERKPESMRELVEHGQKPEVLLIGCSDSRVDPAILMEAEPGELFMVRNVANLVPPYQPDGSYHGTSAAIEYAVTVLEVRHVIVLGHAGCGGMQGLVRLRKGEQLAGAFVAPWVSIAGEACNRFLKPGVSEEDEATLVERAAVRGSLENLMSFPFVRERVESGALHLHGWWFDLADGELWLFDPAVDDFSPVF